MNNNAATMELFRSEKTRDQFTPYLGMIIALASWGMLFATLFLCYAFLRLRTPMWPPIGVDRLPLMLPGINTVLLLVSSLVLHSGLIHIRLGKNRELCHALLLTIVLGASFLGSQFYVWLTLWERGLTLESSGIYGSIFYGFTIFHALHVLCGLGMLAWLYRQTTQSLFHENHWQPIRLGAMFWHFMDFIWVFMFITVYIL